MKRKIYTILKEDMQILSFRYERCFLKKSSSYSKNDDLKFLFKYLLITCLMIFSNVSKAQDYQLNQSQQYFLNELKDANYGQIYYAYNYPKAHKIYNELVNYSGMRYPIFFNQTFQWGQAHNGGLIFIDYSILNKNSNILAFVIAHEWGHQAKGHQSNFYHPEGSTFRFRQSSTEFEDEADEYAARFLASNNYNLDIVYNFLYSLPTTDDHTHSTGKERAALVKEVYYTFNGLNPANKTEDRNQVVIVACTHPAHPNGHTSKCIHPMHSSGDLVNCGHICTNYYGYAVACHPNGDLISCVHPMHYNGDFYVCEHPLHPNGDPKTFSRYK